MKDLLAITIRQQALKPVSRFSSSCWIDKLCKTCGADMKSVFYRQLYCKNCFKQKELDRSKQYRITNEAKLKARYYHKSKKYNINKEQEWALIADQKFQCPICTVDVTTLSYKEICVDHDHITNKVRGILCSKCNIGLGYFQDKINSLQNAIEYLKRSCE